MLKIAFFNFLLLIIEIDIFFVLFHVIVNMKHDFNLLNTRLWLR